MLQSVIGSVSVPYSIAATVTTILATSVSPTFAVIVAVWAFSPASGVDSWLESVEIVKSSLLLVQVTLGFSSASFVTERVYGVSPSRLSLLAVKSS